MTTQNLTEDQEMLQAFGEEIKAIKVELAPVVEGLKTNPNQPALIEKFGQVIDRIYGTAATLGFKEVAEYTKTMKTVCYKASQSKNTYAIGKVKDLIWVCMQNFDRLEKSVLDPALMRQLRLPFQSETDKANTFMKTILSKISRGSVAA